MRFTLVEKLEKRLYKQRDQYKALYYRNPEHPGVRRGELLVHTVSSRHESPKKLEVVSTYTRGSSC